MMAPDMRALPPGLVIAAPRSGAGKTTVTLGLLRALSRGGTRVQPFKCGPDYIDPAFHAAACGRASFNVDSWGMPRALVGQLLDHGCEGADVVIAEALMGLYDGVETPGAWGNGSSADIAALTGWPVVLVLDVSGQSQTAAAVARGFKDFRPGVTLAGVILNRTGSARHVRLASAGLVEAGIAVLGAIPRQTEVALPERHLGLVQAEETLELSGRLDALADLVEAHVDVGAVRAAMAPGRIAAVADARGMQPPGQRIALARDAAFSFVYPHVLALWRAAGAEIVPFSPLADEGPDPRCDVAWLPGGYPELHAGRIAANNGFLSGLRAFARAKPVHGECGGYMVLGAGLVDKDGTRHAMAGLLGLETSYATRRMQLGYRRARLLSDCPMGTSGGLVRGHEFHYATILAAADEPLFDLFDAEGTQLSMRGGKRGQVTGSFFHMLAPG